MKNFIFYLIVVATLTSQAQNWQWVKTGAVNSLDGSSHEFRIKTDAMGNTYLAGFIFDTVTVGNTQITKTTDSCLFVVKLNQSGICTWVTKLKGVTIGAMAVDNQSNLIIAGCLNCTFPYNSTMDNYLLKFNSSGVLIWNQKISGTLNGYREIFYLQTDNQNNIYLKGLYSDSMQIGALNITGGAYNPFIAKCDANGDFYWIKQYPVTFTGGSNTTLSGAKIFIQKNDSLITLDTAGNVLSQKPVIINSNIHQLRFVSDANGDLYAMGVFFDTLHLGSYSFTEVHPCSQSFGGCGDIFLFKMDQNGQVLWAKMIYSMATDLANDILISTDSCVNIVGSHQQYLHIDTSIYKTTDALFIAKYSSTGELVMVKDVDKGFQWDLRLTESNTNLFFAGIYYSPIYTPPTCIDFGNDSLCNYTGYFVAKLGGGSYNDISSLSTTIFTIVPNPSSGKYKIHGSIQEMHVKIYNQMGEHVSEVSGNEIDISNQPGGIYLMEITCGKDRKITKIVKE
jgi:hypothetical protein